MVVPTQPSGPDHADRTDDASLSPHPAASGATDHIDRLFDRVYPSAVGVARRVLDRDGVALGSSLPLAEEIAMEAFVRCAGPQLRDDHRGVAKVMCRVADSSLDRIVGHPGMVPLHPELLGAEVEFDGWLPISELQQALCDLRRTDRRVGVLALAAGFTPTEVSALLDLALDETLRRLARVGVRLADGRRLGADLSPMGTPP